MTVDDRVSRLVPGQRVTVALSNARSERITGTVVAVTPLALRVDTGNGIVSIGRAHGFIWRLRIEP